MEARSVKIPMTATRMLRLAKASKKTMNKTVVDILTEGLKNLGPANRGRKV